MATTIITTPLGTIITPKFTLSLPRMTWDPLFAAGGVDLLPDHLTVISGDRPGQGICAYPEFALNTGLRYWEMTWTGLTNPALQGGPGLCNIPAIDDYASLAANGTGGLTIHPDGTVVYQDVSGNLNTINSGLIAHEGDTIGFLMNFDFPAPTTPPYMTIIGVTADLVAATAQVLSLSDLCIPCATFGDDNPGNSDAITANFSLDRNAYLGPIAFPDIGWDSISFGWPNTA